MAHSSHLISFLLFLSTFLHCSHGQYHPEILHLRPGDAKLAVRGAAPVPASNLPANWTYAGCYNDSQADRTLSGANTYSTTDMNATFCISFCTSQKYVYAGTEYSSQCWCSNSIAAGATLQPNGSCSMGCTYNSSEACGGPDLLTVYYANAKPASGPITNPGPAGWTSYGCWEEPSNTRLLSNQVNVAGGSSNMTVSGCTNACSAAGYKLAGVEYASQCFCDNYLSTANLNTSLSQCSMTCSGNNSEYCGAGNRLDLYAFGNTVPAVRPADLVPPPPPGWYPQGCYNDSVNYRALPVAEYLDVPMTVETCASACLSAGYVISGTEYAGQCFCGNSFLYNSMPVTDGRCNMACQGNSNETCGGANGLSVIKYTGWLPVGCWNDTVGQRTLEYQQYGLPSMTYEICTNACAKAGYNISGVEYGGECYCDNAPQNNGGPAIDGNAGCNMPCAGDASEICGGADRLDVFTYNSTGMPTISTTSSSTTGPTATASSTTTALPAPSSSVNQSAIAPYKYAGCYTEGNGGRALTFQQPDNANMTVEYCVSECSALNYSIAGLEYSTQCFCDNYIHYNASRIADSQCSMACGGNPGEMCGAGNILSIYANGTNGTLTSYIEPIIQTTGLPGSWKYQGCLTDADNNRSLPYEIVWEYNNTNVACLEMCQQFGYGAAGTEYGQQCFCGDVQNVIDAGATIVDNSQCNMVCSEYQNSNGGYLCGGSARMSYYTWEGAEPLNSWDFPTGDAAGQYEFLIGGVMIPLVISVARNNKVVYLGKYGTDPANNNTGAYELDLTQINNFTEAWRPMHVETDVFCSASITLPDRAGRQMNVGGWANDATYAVRLYWPDGSPGEWGQNDWHENLSEVSLLNGRWYPSQMILANGSILVIGGEVGSNGAPVPTLEVLPSPSGEVIYADYLERTDPYNLYPYAIVLPSGGVFLAYYNEARILDPVTLQTQRVLPNMPGAVNNFLGGRTYPFEGSGILMPQYAPYTEPLTFMACGGSTPGPEIALDNCVSIQPDVPNTNWTIERMPSQRVMPCIAPLPDGTFLIANGAHQGVAGFGLATSPNTNAVLYDPSKPVNFRMSVMANTTVARLYHSEASLLDDGRVLISGSDPEDVRSFAPQEFRMEVFIPPYLMGNPPPPRPSFNLTNLDWAYGQSVTFAFTPSRGNLTSSTSNYRVSLISAVSSTHGNSMNQRTIFPECSCSGTTCTVVAPPNANISPPSWHQMFLLDDNNIPSNATWVRIGGDPAQLGNWPNFPDFNTPGMGPVEAIPGVTYR